MMSDVTSSTPSTVSASMWNGALTQLRSRFWTAEKQLKKDEGEAKVEGAEDASFKTVKKLINPLALKEIKSVQNSCRNALKNISLSFPLDNVIFVSNSYRDEARKIVEYHSGYLESKVDKLIYGGTIKVAGKSVYLVSYGDLVNEARAALGPAFNEADYPTEADLRARFTIKLAPWFDISPGTGSDDSFLKEMMTEFQQDASIALRARFTDIVKGIVGSLTDKVDEATGETKRRPIFASHFEKLQKFMALYEDISVVANDGTLTAQVKAVKETLLNSQMWLGDEHGIKQALVRVKGASHIRTALVAELSGFADAFKDLNEETEAVEEKAIANGDIEPDVVDPVEPGRRIRTKI